MRLSPDAILNSVKRRSSTSAQFFHYLISRYMADGCRESAAALTYMSLFAVVPLITLMYAMLSIIPSFQGLGDQIEQLLFENLMPQSGLEVQQYLRDFSSQARKLSSVGGFILVITSYLMLTNIEKTFNRIWGTVGGRRGLSSLLVYWGVLSFGPLLVGAGLIMHTYLLSFQLMIDEVDALGISAVLLEYLPWAMTWAGFTLLFVAMPNCRVEGRYAVIGGLFSMILFELGKGLFGFLVTNSSYHTVYGAFAIVPLFLLWTYLCWMIILGGAELVRSFETFNTSFYRQRLPDLVALVMICAECLRRQQSGAMLSDRDMISLGLQEEQWRSLRTILLARRVLVITDHNTYVLSRDPSTLTVWDLNKLLPNSVFGPTGQGEKAIISSYPWYQKLEPLVNKARDHAQSLYSISLQELLVESNKAE